MDDIPDIIIRTPEERQAEENFPWGLSVRQFNSGHVMIYTGVPPKYTGEGPIPGDEHSERKSWRFKTEESMLLFAAVRIREMRQDGVAEIGAPYALIYNAHPDRRLSPDSYDNKLRIGKRGKKYPPLVW